MRMRKMMVVDEMRLDEVGIHLKYGN